MNRLSMWAATAEDGAELARLRWALSAEYSDHVSDGEYAAFADGFVEWWMSVVDTGEWDVVVTGDGERLVGNVWGRRVTKVPKPGTPAGAWTYVTNVYVEPAWRNAGVGSLLLGAVLEHSRRQGRELAVVWPAERSAPLYRRLGFAPPAELLQLVFHG